MNPEIIVLPFFGYGHLVPCIELCKHLTRRNYKATLVVPSNLSTSVIPIIAQNPLISLSQIRSTPIPPGSLPFDQHRTQFRDMMSGLPEIISAQFNDPTRTRPIAAIVDVMMSWSKRLFVDTGVHVVTFFTSGACSAAMEYAAWRAHPHDMNPGDSRLLPGLPDSMCLRYWDLKQRPVFPEADRDSSEDKTRPKLEGPFGNGPPKGMPKPGDEPMWLKEMEGSVGILVNTCDDLERPFVEYISDRIGIPVLGVGPLMPEKYWSSAGSIIRGIHPTRDSNYTEDEVTSWLDLKPKGSVLYVSFGSEVGPTEVEYVQLARALEASHVQFVWVVRNKSDEAHPFGEQVGGRGLVIHGWAPQMLILSHPSTGGFLSHCGWNSTVESVGRGVPILAWPIRGDQYYNAKLVVSHLKIGHLILDGDLSKMVGKDEIVNGIEMLMKDDEVKKRAAKLHDTFSHGFPKTSERSLDAFVDFIKAKST